MIIHNLSIASCNEFRSDIFEIRDQSQVGAQIGVRYVKSEATTFVRGSTAKLLMQKYLSKKLCDARIIKSGFDQIFSNLLWQTKILRLVFGVLRVDYLKQTSAERTDG